jgi:glycosyltransferase involved in cell wall biosynthesis
MRLDIVMADNSPFDGRTLHERPLGGAQAGFAYLAQALAAQGHRVRAYTGTDRTIDAAGVSWLPLSGGTPEAADLYIANRASKLIGLVPRARRRVLWLRNPAQHLKKPKFLLPLARWRPTLVVTGDYHAATVPWWVPRRALVKIPHGTDVAFQRKVPRDDAPRPRALFTSNPERGLEWVVRLWTERVQPQVGAAELHVFSGASTYGGRKAERMAEIVERARVGAGDSVRFHEPVRRSDLVQELAEARLMIYPGDPGETFCQAAAEAQAMGVPLVTQPIGSLPERVEHGRSGFVAADPGDFAEACVRLLSDDALWRAQHQAALQSARWTGWDTAATRFADLVE